ncbi:MAG TPA: hypothetical protein VFH14_09330 [Gemmatimonadaceae bacterium]|nr:hypothetical protein [Gemmatimonadaceae bacterium]
MGDGLGTLLPILGGIQWISGLVLAVAALRRARTYDRPGGLLARTSARLAIVLFSVAALDLLLRASGLSARVANWLPADFNRDTWHVRALLIICGAAWLMLLIAASVNASLGVGERRRSAAEELRRRMGGRRTPY